MVHLVVMFLFLGLYAIGAEQYDHLQGGDVRCTHKRNLVSGELGAIRAQYQENQSAKKLLSMSMYLCDKNCILIGPKPLSWEVLQDFCRNNEDVLKDNFLPESYQTALLSIHQKLEGYDIDEEGFIVPSKDAREKAVVLFFDRICEENKNRKKERLLLELSRYLFVNKGCRIKGPRALSIVALQMACRAHMDSLKEFWGDDIADEDLFYAEVELSMVDGFYVNEDGDFTQGRVTDCSLDDYSRQESIDVLIQEYMEPLMRLKVLATVNEGAANSLLQTVIRVRAEMDRDDELPLVVDWHALQLFCCSYIEDYQLKEECMINGRGVCLVTGVMAYNFIQSPEYGKELSLQQKLKRKKSDYFQKIDRLGVSARGKWRIPNLCGETICFRKAWCLSDLSEAYEECKAKYNNLKVLYNVYQKAQENGFVLGGSIDAQMDRCSRLDSLAIQQECEKAFKRVYLLDLRRLYKEAIDQGFQFFETINDKMRRFSRAKRSDVARECQRVQQIIKRATGRLRSIQPQCAHKGCDQKCDVSRKPVRWIPGAHRSSFFEHQSLILQAIKDTLDIHKDKEDAVDFFMI